MRACACASHTRRSSSSSVSTLFIHVCDPRCNPDWPEPRPGAACCAVVVECVAELQLARQHPDRVAHQPPHADAARGAWRSARWQCVRPPAAPAHNARGGVAVRAFRLSDFLRNIPLETVPEDTHSANGEPGTLRLRFDGAPAARRPARRSKTARCEARAPLQQPGDARPRFRVGRLQLGAGHGPAGDQGDQRRRHHRRG